MDQLLPRLLLVVAIVAAVVFDWPRAVAGAVVGFAARWIPSRVHPFVVGVAGVVVVAGAAELVYPLFWRSYQASLEGLAGGLAVAGMCAFGLSRLIGGLIGRPD